MLWTPIRNIYRAFNRAKEATASKHILVFYSNTNRKGKADATGAFIPEALAFQKYHSIPDQNCIGLDLEGPPRMAVRSAVYTALNKASTERAIDAIAFFGHGWPTGIQFGFSMKQVDNLAAALSSKCSNDVKIVFYACLTAENSELDTDIEDIGPATDGGFCDALRDSMTKYGITRGWIDGHKTKGHTTRNPYVVRFLCRDGLAYSGLGGAWLVAPRSEFWQKWYRYLHSSSSKLRYEFPMLTELELKLKLKRMSIWV